MQIRSHDTIILRLVFLAVNSAAILLVGMNNKYTYDLYPDQVYHNRAWLALNYFPFSIMVIYISRFCGEPQRSVPDMEKAQLEGRVGAHQEKPTIRSIQWHVLCTALLECVVLCIGVSMMKQGFVDFKNEISKEDYQKSIVSRGIVI